jgi:hypothetical protein
MPEEKKDILEFPLEDVSIPQAIGLMMQAATTTVSFNEHDDSLPERDTDMDRLTLLCEKLENRVEDELTKGARTEPVPEDNPNEPIFSDIEGHKVSLEEEVVEGVEGRVITKVLVDNMVYVLMCNERVFTDPTLVEPTTTCIKRFGHYSPEHEDQEGNVR